MEALKKVEKKKEKITTNKKEQVSISDLLRTFTFCEEKYLKTVTIEIHRRIQEETSCDEAFGILKEFMTLRKNYGTYRYEEDWSIMQDLLQDYLIVLINKESREAERISKGFINLLERFHEVKKAPSIVEAIEKKISQIRLVSEV